MNLPDFLNDNQSLNSRNGINNNTNGNSLNSYDNMNGNNNHNMPNGSRRDSLPINGNNNISSINNDDPLSSQSNFNDILFNKLNDLSINSPNLEFLNNSYSNNINQNNNNNISLKDSFNLPLELQGGVSNISSRRPSYAAESFTRSNFFNNGQSLNNNPHQSSPLSSQNSSYLNNGNGNGNSNGNENLGNNFEFKGINFSNGNGSSNSNNNNRDLSSYAMMNSFQSRNYQFRNNTNNNNGNFDLNDSFNDMNFGLGSKFSQFQSRRPSQLVDYPYQYGTQQQQQHYQQYQQFNGLKQQSNLNNTFVPFQDGLNSTQFQNQNQKNQHQSPKSQHLQNYQTFIPSQQNQQQQQQQSQSQYQPQLTTAFNSQQQQIPGQPIKLENGLLLKDQYIIASQELKELYSKTINYFQNPELTNEIVRQMNELLNNSIIIKLITFIKNLNNLTFNHKILCLIINKNGKFDLLSYPNNSNIFLQKNDLIIIDGDRGKDLVMIIEPLVNLNFAILFNFLKKLEHLKSLTINDESGGGANGAGSSNGVTGVTGGTHPTSMNASTIINSRSNQDNEFIITLPTKQVLRFATPKEVHKLSGKFLEEKKAFITCYNKIKELGLENQLNLINVEYQFDFKKLIFYYFAGFNRIDFRNLIKELFKIYKTRIWLCAVLPFNQPELYVTKGGEETDDNEEKEKEKVSSDKEKQESTETNETNETIETNNNEESKTIINDNLIPKEYNLTNDQILNFSIIEFSNLLNSNYFHSINLKNLIQSLNMDLKTEFYGFNNAKTTATAKNGIIKNGISTTSNKNDLKLIIRN
ncbi:uncharacterized protein KGF55_001663 [Candida pseudojiufengensis]|uniref:uncharacterized protein n=1 Tax=Candida pseudojiufengensis TaxID=497109 RepID=UPI002224C027|nr:uncharacterized protein KGF55_001663 [Candida pseudojiufengensis]KAI5964594.1 hypothetical protein KGF55_001663 [Candida pseudojiufengensis]